MTFKEARTIILDHWQDTGLTVKRDLKIPHATDHTRGHRYYLKPHTIHLDNTGAPFNLGNARSLHIDNRHYAKNILKEKQKCI